jgi:hypothetical protein
MLCDSSCIVPVTLPSRAKAHGPLYASLSHTAILCRTEVLHVTIRKAVKSPCTQNEVTLLPLLPSDVAGKRDISDRSYLTMRFQKLLPIIKMPSTVA